MVKLEDTAVATNWLFRVRAYAKQILLVGSLAFAGDRCREKVVGVQGGRRVRVISCG